MTQRDQAPRPGVLVISASPVGSVMAGPAIRASEFAKALRPHASVTLASVERDDGKDTEGADVIFRQQDPRALRPHIATADAIVTQPPWPLVAHWARRSGARLIYDMYGPEPLEWLAHRAAVAGEESRAREAMRSIWEKVTLDRVVGALSEGHHFLCASEKQRDMWIGAMLAERVIDEDLYRRDPSLRSIIDLAPFGLPDEPPHPTGSGGIRASIPEIGADDEIVLWNGGIWDWLDAATAIRGIDLLAKRRPRAKLVFMGRGTGPSGWHAAKMAHGLAEELGILNRSVFFNEGWVPYDERVNWLLEADTSVSAHTDNLETRFAFRTRLLDCFWARLPIVCTEGDELAARVEREDLGRTVPASDPVTMASALETVLDRGRDSYADRLTRVAEEFKWPTVAASVIRFATLPGRPARSRRGTPHPGRLMRTFGFRTARSTLNSVGLDRWPSG